MIPCQKCGRENELGRVFCRWCGTKLDLEAIKPPEQAKSFWKEARRRELKKSGRSVGRRVWVWSRIIILLCLVACVVLMLNTPEARVIKADKQTKATAQRKVNSLMSALMRGESAVFEFSEAEIFSLIPELRTEPSAAKLVSYQSKWRQLELSENKLASVVTGNLALGRVVELPITVKLEGQTKVRNNTLVFEETGLVIGRLPIPRLFLPAFQFLLNRTERLWSDEVLKEQRQMLGRAKDVYVRAGKLVIETGPAATPAQGQPAGK